MVCSLVAATLILPALAYAQNNQGDEGRCFRPGIPNGTYAFEASGYISGPPICSAAQLTFFADGKITGLSSFSVPVFPPFSRVGGSGTFKVNGDGSVSLSLTTPSETINFDAYFTPDGNTFTFVETDPGTIVSGFATRGRYFY